MIVECHAPVADKSGWPGNSRVDRDMRRLEKFGNIFREQVVGKMEDVDLEMGCRGIRKLTKRVFQELIGRLDNVPNA